MNERLNLDAENMKKELGRVIEVPDNEPEKNSFPAIDRIYVLDLNTEQILERASKLRRDPTTGIIYDPVVNPAPENDKKLIARLESIQVDSEQVAESAAKFDERVGQLRNYFDVFGFPDLRGPILNHFDASLSPQELEKFVINDVKKLLEYKYKIYESEVLPPYIKTLLPEEMSDKDGIENSERNIEGLGSRKLMDSSLSPDRRDPEPRNPSFRDISGGVDISGNKSNLIGSKQLVRKPSYYSASMRGSRKDNASQKSGGTRRERWISRGLDTWNSIFKDYTENLAKSIKQFKEHFNIMRLHLYNSQIHFANIFKENGEFANPLYAFLESFRRFVSDNPDAIKNPYTKNKLKAKIDSIHDRLWYQIKTCQEKAEEEKATMLTRNLVNADIHFLCKTSLNMVASELNKLYNVM